MGQEGEKPHIIEKDLEDKDFLNHRGEKTRVRWPQFTGSSEENERLAIRTVQTIFLNEFPEFSLQFPRDQNGQIVEEKRNDAKAFVLSVLGDKEDFNQVLYKSLQGRQGAIFDHSFHVVLQKTFSDFGVDCGFHVIDKKTGKYTDQNGETWAPVAILAQEFDCDARTVIRNLEGIPRISGYGRNGHDIELYNESIAKAALDTFDRLARLPQSGRGNSGKIVVDGRTKVTVSYLQEKFKISKKAFHKIGEDLSFTTGKAGNGLEAKYFDEEEALQRIQAWNSLPQEEVGEPSIPPRFVNFKRLAKEIGVDSKTLRPYLKELPTIQGRSVQGRSTILYDRKAALSTLQSSGFYESRKELKTASYWTNERIMEEAREFLDTKGNISQALLVQNGRVDLCSAIQGHYPGKITQLKVDLGIGASIIKSEIRPEEAREELDKLFLTGQD